MTVIKTKCPNISPPMTYETFRAMFVGDTSSCVEGLNGQKDALKLLGDVISGLLDLRYEKHIREFAQLAEKPLCVNTINSLAYVFYASNVLVITMAIFTVVAIRFAAIKKRDDENAEKEAL